MMTDFSQFSKQIVMHLVFYRLLMADCAISYVKDRLCMTEIRHHRLIDY